MHTKKIIRSTLQITFTSLCTLKRIFTAHYRQHLRVNVQSREHSQPTKDNIHVFMYTKKNIHCALWIIFTSLSKVKRTFTSLSKVKRTFTFLSKVKRTFTSFSKVKRTFTSLSKVNRTFTAHYRKYSLRNKESIRCAQVWVFVCAARAPVCGSTCCIHVHIHEIMNTYIHTCICTHSCTLIRQSQNRVHMITRKNTHTNVHTYIHTYAFSPTKTEQNRQLDVCQRIIRALAHVLVHSHVCESVSARVHSLRLRAQCFSLTHARMRTKYNIHVRVNTPKAWDNVYKTNGWVRLFFAVHHRIKQQPCNGVFVLIMRCRYKYVHACMHACTSIQSPDGSIYIESDRVHVRKHAHTLTHTRARAQTHTRTHTSESAVHHTHHSIINIECTYVSRGAYSSYI